MSALTIDIRESTLIGTINRPEALNAINFKVMEQLEDLLDRLEQENSICSLILSGAGNEYFISGGDLKEFHSIETAKEAEKMARRMGSILRRFEKLPCWTIAAINGATYGGGWEMMLACDFRIAATNATFHFTQSKFYLPPGWGGLTRLVEKVGRSTALRWLAEAAEIDAQSAKECKLIDRIVSDQTGIKEESLRWAQRMNRNGRDFIKNLKSGALKFSQARWRAIEEELEPFAQFWEDERHLNRVEQFLGRKK